MQTLDRVRGPCAAALGRWQASESEEAVAGFLQAVGDGAMTQPPLADESVAARRDLLGVRRKPAILRGCIPGLFYFLVKLHLVRATLACVMRLARRAHPLARMPGKKEPLALVTPTPIILPQVLYTVF